MTIQVTGVLVDPINQPIPNATIRITSLETSLVVVATNAKVVTGLDGSYDFTLLNGKYAIEVLQSNKYFKIAYIEVTGATTTPITLESLIDTYSFCEVTAPVCAV